ncbi:hypothetical protein CAEBREN_12748 [Caenorhabditis brenneri]|uniref:Uncharacterized protein n=1 Tax=Caenorhabditis brenneri TaxID=135651 RepID=G0NV54_CAEBE|nr:hypothetical protein CAEBREN_12748 [Caenorhabditis brenneri]
MKAIMDTVKFDNAFKKVNENEGIDRQIERGEEELGSAFIKKAMRFKSFEACVLIIGKKTNFTALDTLIRGTSDTCFMPIYQECKRKNRTKTRIEAINFLIFLT